MVNVTNNMSRFTPSKVAQQKALMNILSQIEDLGDGTYRVPSRSVSGRVVEFKIMNKDELDFYILKQMSMLRSAMSETLTMQDEMVRDDVSIWQDYSQSGEQKESRATLSHVA